MRQRLVHVATNPPIRCSQSESGRALASGSVRTASRAFGRLGDQLRKRCANSMLGRRSGNAKRRSD